MKINNLKVTGALNAEMARSNSDEYINEFIRADVERRMKQIFEGTYVKRVEILAEYNLVNTKLETEGIIRLRLEHSTNNGTAIKEREK